MIQSTLRPRLHRLATAFIGIALGLTLLSGLATAAGAATVQETPTTFRSPAECEALLQQADAAIEAGDMEAWNTAFLSYFYGKCGAWGEPEL